MGNRRRWRYRIMAGQVGVVKESPSRSALRELLGRWVNGRAWYVRRVGNDKVLLERVDLGSSGTYEHMWVTGTFWDRDVPEKPGWVEVRGMVRTYDRELTGNPAYALGLTELTWD